MRRILLFIRRVTLNFDNPNLQESNDFSQCLERVSQITPIQSNKRFYRLIKRKRVICEMREVMFYLKEGFL